MLSKEREDAVIDLCRELVRTKSYSGEEQDAAARLRAFFAAQGFDDVETDGYGNVIGHIKGSRPGPKILFDGHIDTVPVTDPAVWTHDPFAAEIVDGKIYGRGTSDMKGAVAAMASAAANFAADCKKDFAGDIYVDGIVHEECFEGVASRLVSARVKPDYVIIGESTHGDIRVGQRGRAEIKLEVFGRPAHSASPQKGVNAVYGLAEIIPQVRKLVPPHDDRLGDGIMELVDIKSSPYPGASVVPEYCSATYDRRLLMGETPESVLAPLQKLIDEMMAENPQLKAKVSFARGEERCYTGEKIAEKRFFPGWVFDKNADYVTAVAAELKRAGLSPEIGVFNFCTNGSHYAGEAGIKTLGLGPSLETLAHTIDEYIEIGELTKITESYYAVMKALLK